MSKVSIYILTETSSSHIRFMGEEPEVQRGTVTFPGSPRYLWHSQDWDRSLFLGCRFLWFHSLLRKKVNGRAGGSPPVRDELG